jgi:hypothetical protein
MKHGWTLAGMMALLLCTAAVAPADDVPEPNHVLVVPADVTQGPVIAPGHPSPIASCIQTITVRSWNNTPIPNALVQVLFGPGIHTCPDAVLTTTADASGVAIMPLTGGGCMYNAQNTACIIKANQVVVRSYSDARSPDRDGNFTVDLNDLLAFVADYRTHAPGCSDFDGNGATNFADLLVFAAAYVPRHSCP